MRAEVKEKVYLLIIIFCVVMCAAMIVTMITDGRVENGEKHVPAMLEGITSENGEKSKYDENASILDTNDDIDETNEKTTADRIENDKISSDKIEHQIAEETSGQIAVTEDFINEKLVKFFPASFPINDPIIDIGADGVVTLSGELNRDELKSYLKKLGVDIGIKYSVALLMLPKEFDGELALDLTGEKDGTMRSSLKYAKLNGKDISLSMLPEKVTDVISDTVNKIVSNIAGELKFYGFEDGAILFKKL